MAELELTQLRARWSTYGGMGNPRDAEDYTDAGCRTLAEHAFRDCNALLDEIDRLAREHAEMVERFLAWPHEDWCCAKGCTAPIGCHGCAGDCRCVRALAVAGLALPEEPTTP